MPWADQKTICELGIVFRQMLYKCPIIFVKSLRKTCLESILKVYTMRGEIFKIFSKKNVWIPLSKGLYYERTNKFKLIKKSVTISLSKGLYYERVNKKTCEK